MKTYLITGGCGFIGSNFIKFLTSQFQSNVTIINLDKLTYAANPESLIEINDQNNYHFFHGDICDKNILNRIFEQFDVDYVINFAAESHVDRSIEDPEVFIRTNVLGTQTLLNNCRKYWSTSSGFPNGKIFLQVSTDEVYGSLGDDGYFTEDTPINPSSPYSASKASADLLVQSFFHTYRMPTLITRCSNNYGPHQHQEKLIPTVIHRLLSGEKIPVYGDGQNIRDWLFVRDHCIAIQTVIEKGRVGEIYNIGGKQEHRNLAIIEQIMSSLLEIIPDSDKRKKYISKDLIQFVPDRKGHDYRYAINADKIFKEMTWQPKISLQEGLKQTVMWYYDKLNK